MTSLADNALTNRASVDDMIPSYNDGGGSKDADDRIERWINEGSAFLIQATDRQFYWKSGYTERVAARGEREIWVNDHVPVDTINEITYDTGTDSDTVDADSYEALGDGQGTIRRIGGIWSSTALRQAGIVQGPQPGTEEQIFKVDYDGGWITPKQEDDGVGTRDLPYDIERAVLAYVVDRENRYGTAPDVSEISLSMGSVKFQGHPVPQETARVAKNRRLERL